MSKTTEHTKNVGYIMRKLTAKGFSGKAVASLLTEVHHEGIAAIDITGEDTWTDATLERLGAEGPGCTYELTIETRSNR